MEKSNKPKILLIAKTVFSSVLCFHTFLIFMNGYNLPLNMWIHISSTILGFFVLLYDKLLYNSPKVLRVMYVLSAIIYLFTILVGYMDVRFLCGLNENDVKQSYMVSNESMIQRVMTPEDRDFWDAYYKKYPKRMTYRYGRSIRDEFIPRPIFEAEFCNAYYLWYIFEFIIGGIIMACFLTCSREIKKHILRENLV